MSLELPEGGKNANKIVGWLLFLTLATREFCTDFRCLGKRGLIYPKR